MKKLLIILAFLPLISWGQVYNKVHNGGLIWPFQGHTVVYNPSLNIYFSVFNGINSIGVTPYDTNMQNPNLVLNSQFRDYTGIIDDLIKDSFDDWTLINSATTETPLAVTGYADSVACRIRNDAVRVGGVRQTMDVSPNTDYIISFKHLAEGGAGRYGIYDVTNGAYIIPLTKIADTSSTVWNNQSDNFTTPVSCTSIRVDFFAPENFGAATVLANVNIFEAYDLSVSFFIERNIDSFNIDRDYFVSRLYSESPDVNERSWSIRSIGDDGAEADRGKMRFSYSKTLNTSAGGVYSDTKIDSGVVYHVACTYKYNGNGTSDCKMYINGVLENTSTNISHYIVNAVANLTIGDLEPDPYHPASCKLSNIIIDLREFSQAEITQMYNNNNNLSANLKYLDSDIDIDNDTWNDSSSGNDMELQNVTKEKIIINR